ncbi:hypothetical protein FSP39_017605 [Pinctada imbricata]|uniref:Small ribosomal subunit protein mS29 n=1 Tax=Pinctada imbricata TaxID=66713 RepID=A0AA89BW00_PINIB|nr:hypothetical protein FSP39_017605 [Pinctada imbricata]
MSICGKGIALFERNLNVFHWWTEELFPKNLQNRPETDTMAGKNLVHMKFLSSLRRTSALLICRAKEFHTSTPPDNDIRREHYPDTQNYVSSLFSKPSTPVLKPKIRSVSKPGTSIFRTVISDPNEHNMNQEGMFYTIELEEFKNTFPNSITNYINDQVTTLNEATIMVRQPAVECINFLQTLSSDVPMPRIVLFPNLLRKDKEVAPSATLPNKYDLPIGASEFLKYFEDKNKDLLSKFTTKFEYKWTETETTPVDVPLLELVQFGQQRVKFSCDVVGALLKELQSLSNEKRCKVLIAIDGLNSFWNETYMTHEGKKVNSVMLCTVDPIVSSNGNKKEYRPKELLGKEGFELLDPFIPVLVPNYSDKEIFSALNYYEEQLWIQNPEAKTDKGRQEIVFLSGHNPKYLMKIIDPL